MNEFTFKYNDSKPSIIDINHFIDYLGLKYDKKLSQLRLVNDEVLQVYNRNNFISLMQEYKKVVLELIKEVIEFFPQLSEIPNIIFLHGSFARTLNRMNSDIDLSILYSNQYKEKLLPIEELIAIILQKILGYKGRDKIHTVMVYTLDKIECEIPRPITDCIITYEGNRFYHYTIRDNAEELMYRIKFSSREFEDFINYINKYIKPNKCIEWCYSYQVLSVNNSNYNLYGKLKKYEVECITNANIREFEEIIISLMMDIDSYEFDLSVKEVSIQLLNKNIKVKNMGYIYNTLALIRRYLYMNHQYINNLDFFTIFNNSHFVMLFDEEERLNIQDGIFMYIWSLSRIEKIFTDYNLNFSSKNMNVIELTKLKQLYAKIYHEDFIDKQMSITTKMHDVLRQVLLKLLNRIR